MENTMQDRLLTPRDFAHRLGICKSTLYRLRREDPAFPRPIRFGAAVRFSEREIAAYVAHCQEMGPEVCDE